MEYQHSVFKGFPIKFCMCGRKCVIIFQIISYEKTKLKNKAIFMRLDG